MTHIRKSLPTAREVICFMALAFVVLAIIAGIVR